MKEIDYEKVTIENAQNLIKTGYVTEIICDADNKKIKIKEAEYIEIEKAFKKLEETVKVMVDVICELCKKMCDAFNSVFKNFNTILNKKITKKKFMKLLQSEGIQRNAINEIVKNNKEPYTYARYYQILKNTKE
ncbi:MAG: hypothetical protein ACLR1U_03640 [Clostridia bacterium]|jgi:hypothetical protein